MPISQIMFLLVFASKVFAVGIAASLSWWWLLLMFVGLGVVSLVKNFFAGILGYAAKNALENKTPKVTGGLVQRK